MHSITIHEVEHASEFQVADRKSLVPPDNDYLYASPSIIVPFNRLDLRPTHQFADAPEPQARIVNDYQRARLAPFPQPRGGAYKYRVADHARSPNGRKCPPEKRIVDQKRYIPAPVIKIPAGTPRTAIVMDHQRKSSMRITPLRDHREWLEKQT
jgi:hypothetical protein